MSAKQYRKQLKKIKYNQYNSEGILARKTFERNAIELPDEIYDSFLNLVDIQENQYIGRSKKYFEIFALKSLSEIKLDIKRYIEVLNQYIVPGRIYSSNASYVILIILEIVLIGLLRTSNYFLRKKDIGKFEKCEKSIKNVTSSMISLLFYSKINAYNKIIFSTKGIDESSIDFFSNYLEQANPLSGIILGLSILEEGKNYDYIVVPFYGASMTDYLIEALFAANDLKTKALAITTEGGKIRKNLDSAIYSPVKLSVINNKNILIIDDNSGTGSTLAFLKTKLEKYNPNTVDIGVVEVAITRVYETIKGVQYNYNAKIIWPEQLTYKAVAEYNFINWLNLTRKKLSDYEFYI